MEINKMNDILPRFNQSGDFTTQLVDDNIAGTLLTAGVDFYEKLNLITFEKSLSRLQGNYSLQLKTHVLDTSDHHQ